MAGDTASGDLGLEFGPERMSVSHLCREPLLLRVITPEEVVSVRRRNVEDAVPGWPGCDPWLTRDSRLSVLRLRGPPTDLLELVRGW